MGFTLSPTSPQRLLENNMSLTVVGVEGMVVPGVSDREREKVCVSEKILDCLMVLNRQQMNQLVSPAASRARQSDRPANKDDSS